MVCLRLIEVSQLFIAPFIDLLVALLDAFFQVIVLIGSNEWLCTGRQGDQPAPGYQACVHMVTNDWFTIKVFLQIMSSRTQLNRALRLKCPRCGESDLFKDPNPFNLGHLSEMHRQCPHCKLKIEPETGFYYGAMWISYAIGVFASLILIGLLILAFHVDTLWAFIAVVVFHIVFSPYLFRLARAVWLSFYVNQHRDI